jgi:hypothetical protein
MSRAGTGPILTPVGAGDMVVAKSWNVARKRTQGERFLRMAGVADVEAAAALWRDARTPVHRRCLAARVLA